MIPCCVSWISRVRSCAMKPTLGFTCAKMHQSSPLHFQNITHASVQTWRLRRSALNAWASVQCLTIIKAAIRTLALRLNPTRQLITLRHLFNNDEWFFHGFYLYESTHKEQSNVKVPEDPHSVGHAGRCQQQAWDSMSKILSMWIGWQGEGVLLWYFANCAWQ